MAIQTADANGGEIVLLGPVELFLRASALLALVGLGFGIAALPVARLPARRAELLAVLGICLSTVPVALAYERTLGLVVIGAAAIGPWTWFTRWGGVGRLVALAGLAAGVVLWTGWLVLRLAEPVAGVALRDVLGAWIAVGALLLVVLVARMTPRRLATAAATTRLVDVVVMAGAIVVAIGLFGLGISPLLASAVVVLPLILLVGTRRQVADGLERVLLADLREREAIRATEEERARVSREIHDDPLQQIAGVIHRLEGADPDPAAATASLRDVAAKLRGVATELHPPVLDDLGLAPAIEGAARQITAPPVHVAVANHAGYGSAHRPSAGVELAAFRIVQEAIANAVRHAAATGIRVSGEVAPDAIDLAVADDGRGVTHEAVETAQRDGHMGVASMRARGLDRRPAGHRPRARWGHGGLAPVAAMRVRVLVVEDHPIVVSGLVATLSAAADIEVVGQASSVAAARSLLASTGCDVVLLDLRLSDGSGIELLEAAAGRDDGPAFLVLSSFVTPEYVAAALALGAAGFLLKTAPSEEILEAIGDVAGGGLAFTADQLRASRGAPWAPLTPREHDLLAGLLAGRSNDELGSDLGLSRKSVESYITRLFARYDVVTRTELALRVDRSAVLDLPTQERRPGPR